MPGFFSSRIEQARHALTRIRQGETISDERLSDIRWLERTIGLDRPLTEYSPRSQRRIFQRLREGATTREDIYRREYQAERQRKQRARDDHGLSPSQWNTIVPLRDRIKQLNVGDVEHYMDDEVLKDFVTIYGYEYLRTVLSQQINSTEEYLNGNAAPGNQRWHARGELERRFGASAFVPYAEGTTPFYFYHGRHK